MRAYVVKIESSFLKIKNLKMSLTKDIDNAAYWTSKKDLNTWKSSIDARYPNNIICNVGFKIITS